MEKQKSNILIVVLLSLFLIAASSGRTISLLEPVVPSQTVVITDQYYRHDERNTTIYKKAQPYLKQGFIIKSVACSGTQTTFLVIMVLGKY
jgi:hypothetical protein